MGNFTNNIITSNQKGWNGSTWESARVDAATNAFDSINYQHHKIHAGSHFFHTGYVTLSSGANYDFIFKVADTTAWPHMFFELQNVAEVTYSFYEDVTTTADGTTLAAFNNNRNNSTTSAGLIISHTPTNPSLGASGLTISANIVGSGKKLGGESRNEHEFIMKQNVKYWLRITEGSSAENIVNWQFNWYEHSDIN